MIRTLHDASVRTKLILASIVPAAASILVVSVIIGVYLRAESRVESVASLEAVAAIIGDNGAASLTFLNPEDGAAVLRTLEARPSIVSAAIYDANGHLFASYSSEGQEGGFTPPPSPPADGARFVEGDLVVTRPIMLGEIRLGTTLIASDMRDLASLTRRIALAEVMVGILALLVAFGVSARLRDVILEPISRLSRLARTVSEGGDPSARVEPQGNDELGRLAVAFNEMLDEIDRHDSALRESAENWRSLVENAPDFIFIVDEEHRILSTNRLLPGTRPEDVLGGVAEDLVEPENRSLVSEAIDHVLRTGEPRSYEVKFSAPDGRIHTFLTRASPIRRDGVIKRAILVSSDLTDQLRLEDQLRQAQKMEAVGQLTGGVAHDFNNLLTVVLGNIELLKDRLSHGDPLHDLADGAIEAGERGAALTQRLLAFSRKQALNPKVFDLGKTVAGMIGLLRRSLGEDVEIETVIDPGLWHCIADRAQTENVILNLAINARDAMPEGGSLTIRAENTRVGTEDAVTQDGVNPGDYVLLTLTDSGKGMPSEVVKQAFDPFFTTKEVGRGSGLGLSMVYGFVKQSGGHVRIYSEPDIGTTIRVYLPRGNSAEDSAEPSKVEGGEPRGRGEIILVVEDDPAVRGFSTVALRSLGYQTLEAADAEAALKLIRDHPDLDMLFTDVVLPGGMSGADLAGRVRADRPDFPVLMTSGYTEHAVLGRVEVDPSQELLQKPFSKADLARKVRSALGERTRNASHGPEDLPES